MPENHQIKIICFVIPRAYYLFYPDALNRKDKVGGAQKQSYILSTELAKDQNFDVRFCMADFGQTVFEVRENVTLWNAFNFNDHLIKRTIKVLRTLKQINAETYIFRSPDIGVAVAVFYLKKCLRKKILYMIAGDMEVSKSRLSKYTGKLTSLLMNYVYRTADMITAQTKQQSEQFYKERKKKPTAVIKNIYTSDHSQFRSEEKKDILWVGRLDKIKNPELYLKLAEKYPSEQFTMIAPVVRDSKNFGYSVQDSAKKMLNVKLIEYVDPKRMYDYYLRCKIYVLTSEFEGFSNTMAEAMQARCAVLTYNVNPDTIFNDFDCGICSDGQQKLFFSNFEKLLNDNELRERLGKNAEGYISKFHGKTENITTFKTLFQ
jgi:glycosyltransferase involved in cell wall biosynthesis